MPLPRLNRRLTLETPERVSDGSGGYVETWNSLGVVWAELRPRTGRETVAQAAPVSSVSYKIILRAAPVGHPARPLPGQRLRDGARLFHIHALTEYDVGGQYLTCFAEEEVVA